MLGTLRSTAGFAISTGLRIVGFVLMFLAFVAGLVLGSGLTLETTGAFGEGITRGAGLAFTVGVVFPAGFTFAAGFAVTFDWVTLAVSLLAGELTGLLAGLLITIFGVFTAGLTAFTAGFLSSGFLTLTFLSSPAPRVAMSNDIPKAAARQRTRSRFMTD